MSQINTLFGAICKYDMGGGEVIHMVSDICKTIGVLKASVICNYDMQVIKLVSFICSMLRGLFNVLDIHASLGAI